MHNYYIYLSKGVLGEESEVRSVPFPFAERTRLKPGKTDLQQLFTSNNFILRTMHLDSKLSPGIHQTREHIFPVTSLRWFWFTTRQLTTGIEHGVCIDHRNPVHKVPTACAIFEEPSE